MEGEPLREGRGQVASKMLARSEQKFWPSKDSGSRKMTYKTKTSYNKSRLRDILWTMIQKHQPNCYLCRQAFTVDILPARRTDLLTEHHIDGDHSNMKLENRVLVHRECHKRYHVKDNIGRR